MPTATGFLVVDANVLLDYLGADLDILALVSRHVGRIHVISTVLDEVSGLDESDCDRLGFRVVDPTIAQLHAATPGDGRLSLQDRLCLIVSREEGWVCVTNDKALRRACVRDAVAVMWGLELMTELVRRRELDAHEAMRLALAIAEQNKYLTQATLDRFREKLKTV